MDDELHIKSRDLCERCAFGRCPTMSDGRNCEQCGAFVPWNADGSLAGCGCALVDDRTPCPFFRERPEAAPRASEPKGERAACDWRTGAKLKARAAE